MDLCNIKPDERETKAIILHLEISIKNGLVPEYLRERTKTNESVHGYSLRNNGDFRLPLYKETSSQKMLLYEGLKYSDLLISTIIF